MSTTIGFTLRERIRLSGEILDRLTRQGIVCELTPDGRDFEFWNARMNDDGDFDDVPPEAVREILEHRQLILDHLQRWARSIDRITRIWWATKPEYREECRNYWNNNIQSTSIDKEN